MRTIIAFLLMCSVSFGADKITSKPNAFGGQNYYLNGKSIGSSRTNNTGGLKYIDKQGRMGNIYGNGQGGTTYRGNADFKGSKGAVLPMLGQGVRGTSGRYGQRPSSRTGSTNQLRSGNKKGK